ncbi:hypothetical protein [Geodermatophilus sp. URMC 63]
MAARMVGDMGDRPDRGLVLWAHHDGMGLKDRRWAMSLLACH